MDGTSSINIFAIVCILSILCVLGFLITLLCKFTKEFENKKKELTTE